MLHFRPGSQAWQLITLLSAVGEFPFRSLRLLGNERVLKSLVTKLSALAFRPRPVQLFSLPAPAVSVRRPVLSFVT